MKSRNQSVITRIIVILLALSTILPLCANATNNNDSKTTTGTTTGEAMAVYYVSPSGSDNNSGLSSDKAFATLEKARDTVRTVNGDMTGDIIVYLLDGTWELGDTLTFDERDSATNGYYIRYVAADGSSPLISGGTELSGTWTEHTTLKNGNTIYKIPLDRDVKLRALYVNGERRYMASTENTIDAKGSWGNYTVGNVPQEDGFTWESIYSEDFDVLNSIGEDQEIIPWSKSGNSQNAILNLSEEDGNKFIEIAHTANEDCGLELPGVTYRNAIITFRLQFAEDHKFTHEWEALHIHGANQVIDNNGRTKWAGIKLAPHLGQTYFQSGTSGGNSGDDVGGQENTTAFTAESAVWYRIKMMVTDNGYYFTKIWRDGSDEPADWSRFESFDNLISQDKFFRIYAYKNNDNSKIDIRVDDIEIKSGTVKASESENELPEWAWSTGTKFDGIQYSRNDLPEITRNVTDVEIENQQTWNKNTVCVREIEAGTNGMWILKLQQPYGAIAQTPGWGVGLQGTGSHIIRNAYELLDQPGEFYFDRSEKMLYYIPVEGEDINTANVVVPELETIVEFKGTPKVSGDLSTAGEKAITGQVENIVFDGVSFAYSDWNLQNVGDSYGKSTVQAGTVYTAYASDNWHGDMYRNLDTLPGAIEMEFAHNIKIYNCEVKLTGAEGILMSNDVDGCEVVGNLVYQTGGGGVVAGNPQHIYENDSLEPDIYAYKVGNGNTYIGTDGAGAEHEKYQNGTERVPRDIKISNNIILESCRLFPSHTPITLFFTQRAEVSHNYIKDAAYSGMSIGWGWCNFDGMTADFLDWGKDNNQGGSVLPGYPTETAFENKIINNRIEDTMTILWDGGLIYTLGNQPGTVISGNYGNGSQHGLYQDEGSANFDTIRDNVIAGTSGGDAIFAVTYGRKHDLHYDNNYSDKNTVTVAPEVNVTSKNFTYIADGLWTKEASDIIQNSGLTAEYRVRFSDILTEIYGSGANALLPQNAKLKAGETLTLLAWLSEADEIWIAPEGTTDFAVSDTMTTAKGNAAMMEVPKTDGTYKLYVVKDGEVSTVSDNSIVCVSAEEEPVVYYFVDCGDADPTTVNEGESLGLYNSVTDQFFGADSETGKKWGVVDEAIDTDGQAEYGDGRVTTTWTWVDTPGDGASKTVSNRFCHDMKENGLDRVITYKFEVPENGEYTVEVGFANPWWCALPVNVYLNGTLAGTCEDAGAPVTAKVTSEDGYITVEAKTDADTINMTYIIISGAPITEDDDNTEVPGDTENPGDTDDPTDPGDTTVPDDPDESKEPDDSKDPDDDGDDVNDPPKTGDDSGAVIWGVILSISLAAISALIISEKKRLN